MRKAAKSKSRESTSALVKAITTKYNLTPTMTKSGKISSYYMADIESNAAKLNRAYSKATDEERNQIERYVKAHIARNVDNIKREARRQREAARELPEGSTVRKSMERRAKEIDKQAAEYKSSSLIVQTGAQKGKKRKGRFLVQTYKRPPKPQKLTKQQAFNEMVTSLKQIGVISGVTRAQKDADEAVPVQITKGAGEEFVVTDDEAPVEFDIGDAEEMRRKQEEKERRIRSAAAGGLEDLFSMDESIKVDVNNTFEGLFEEFPEFADDFFDLMNVTREKKRADYIAAHGEDAPRPKDFGNSPDAIMQAFDTYAKKLQEYIDRGINVEVNQQLHDAVEKAYNSMRNMLFVR